MIPNPFFTQAITEEMGIPEDVLIEHICREWQMGNNPTLEEFLDSLQDVVPEVVDHPWRSGVLTKDDEVIYGLAADEMRTALFVDDDELDHDNEGVSA